jgi:hypothetical protein
MRRVVSVAGLATLFVAGALLAGVATAQTDTTTVTETATTAETTTEPGTTVITTETQRTTTTRRVFVTTTPTSTEASSSSGTPAWVWVLVAALAAAALILAGVLLARRGGPRPAAVAGVPIDERRRRLDNAVGSWAVQGWAIESQTGDSAVLRRGSDLMLVSVDDAGHVSTRPLPNQ